MISFHPDSRLMNEFSAGSLPLAQSACVSIHLNFCEQCLRQSRRLQQLGAALFEQLPQQDVDNTLLDAVMARLDEEPPLSYSTRGVDKNGQPALLQRLMARDYTDLDWNRITSTLRISHLRTGDLNHEFALYHIKAGGSIPQHSHRGTELTLVLEGSFSDEDGVYQPGDFLMRDASQVHSPTATQTADCICIGVLDAPIRFTGWNYRMLNPFLKLRTH
jgi:putative transcriptional regulator